MDTTPISTPADSDVMEKFAVAYMEGIAPLSSTDSGRQYSVKETKKLLRKLDWHLVPFLSLLYL